MTSQNGTTTSQISQTNLTFFCLYVATDQQTQRNNYCSYNEQVQDKAEKNFFGCFLVEKQQMSTKSIFSKT